MFMAVEAVKRGATVGDAAKMEGVSAASLRRCPAFRALDIKTPERVKRGAITVRLLPYSIDKISAQALAAGMSPAAWLARTIDEGYVARFPVELVLDGTLYWAKFGDDGAPPSGPTVAECLNELRQRAQEALPARPDVPGSDWAGQADIVVTAGRVEVELVRAPAAAVVTPAPAAILRRVLALQAELASLKGADPDDAASAIRADHLADQIKALMPTAPAARPADDYFTGPATFFTMPEPSPAVADLMGKMAVDRNTAEQLVGAGLGSVALIASPSATFPMELATRADELRGKAHNALA
jgi:hypothetical protein